MPNLIPGNSANPEFSIWTHPLLEIEYNHFVASFLNGVTQYFMHKYNPALEPGASVRDVAIPDGKLVPWDVLKNRIMKIKEEITSSKYISNCAKYIEVRTDENRVIMNWFPFRAGLVMLKSDLSPEVVSIFENWDDAGEKDKIEVLQKIGGW